MTASNKTTSANKTATRNLDARLSTGAPIVLGLFRIAVGLLFGCHATAHLFGWPSGPAAAAGQWPYFYAGCIELVVAILITFGLFTRIAALIGSGTMAVAYFMQHVPNGLLPMSNSGEPAVLYCFILFPLVFIGGGAFALDNRLGRARL